VCHCAKVDLHPRRATRAPQSHLLPAGSLAGEEGRVAIGVVQERTGDGLEPGLRAGLEEHEIPGSRLRVQGAGGVLRGIGDDYSLRRHPAGDCPVGREAGGIPESDQQVNPCGGNTGSCLAMGGDGLSAQFGHVPEDDDAPPGRQSSESRQRCAERLRAGVVRVVQESGTVQAGEQARPPRQRIDALQPTRDLAPAQAPRQAYRTGGEHGAGVLRPQQRDTQGVRFGAAPDGDLRAFGRHADVRPVQATLRQGRSGVRGPGQNPRARLVRHGTHARIVPVQDGDAVRRQGAYQRRLFPGDGLERAEYLEMA